VPGDTQKSAKGGGASAAAAAAADAADGGAAGGEGRRSKYVVLQQSINIIKSLQLRVAAQDDELRRLRADDSGGGGGAGAGTGTRTPDHPPPGGARGTSSGAATRSGHGGHSGSAEDAALPAVPASSPPGVEVHPGSEAGTCYVRVACADRRGLLADILNALRQMPLEVVRAAITTSKEGYVNDVFELRCAPDAGGAALANEDIKLAVERQLLVVADGKRRKMRATAGGAGAGADGA
jgi:hypothetical protein